MLINSVSEFEFDFRGAMLSNILQSNNCRLTKGLGACKSISSMGFIIDTVVITSLSLSITRREEPEASLHLHLKL